MRSERVSKQGAARLIAASCVAGSLAAGLFAASSCGAKDAPATTPAAAAPATPPAAAPAATPPVVAPPVVAPPAVAPPAVAPPAGAQQAAATPPAAAAGAGAGAAAGAGGGRGGRGGGGRGGERPTPPEPPPAVLPPPATPIVSATPPSPDPRVGLAAGRWTAAQAAWNMRLVSWTPPSAESAGATHSDLAFIGKYVVQGHYNGFNTYDISNPAKPVLVNTYMCPASQNDVSVYRNLLFMSSEATNSRSDCKFGGVPEPVSPERVRGIRIFDISDMARPKLLTSVQTCRGSHTHTVVTQPGDAENVYIYVSGTSSVRAAEELPGCQDGGPDDPNSARFRLEVIKVPLKAPQTAAIVSSPRIFQGLPVPPSNPERNAAGRTGGARGGNAAGAAGAAGAGGAAAGAGAGAAGAGGRAGAAAGAAGAGGAAGAAGAAAGDPAAGAGRGGRGGGRGGPPTGPNQCHDITAYPAMGLAGGACAGLGLLLDIREASHPIRIDMAADANMAFWHSATFSNDGTKVLFTDEWGGGNAARCRDTDRKEWGANAIFTIERNKLVFQSYYKLPAPQTSQENCVAHNGSLVPIPGRDIKVQGWYQGGVSVFDWTDVKNPKEIAFFDRGPLDAARLVSAGSWSAYWYNGVIVSSEIARGLDIFELLPNGLVTQNELDAAKTVRFEYFNTQEQQKFVWPPSFALARAYLDQLERSNGLAASNIASTRTALTSAERASGQARRTALTTLATQLNGQVSGSSDQAKMRLLVAAVTDLAR